MKKIVQEWLNNPANGGWIVVLGVMIILLWVAVAGAHAKTIGKPIYGAPDDLDYYETLKMPDSNTSCCGVADVYWADKTEQAPDGSIVAIITDARPDDRTLPDGREIHRPHVPVGTRVPVPATKLRKHPIPNPTGHTVIWLGTPSEDPDAQYHIVYCYEPQALL